ncbi:M23 family metallopeptidase [Gemmobacter serpentinus]|uniref:M23 family metallopeptidase n=1 Tax=Gemmobacter serpentinus TaxID=2652247 RepID=UPI00124EA764|nr:M23 family metallopeptidase [Gemmobacter serpentinus]
MSPALKPALLAALIAPALPAGAFQLALPVDCMLGESCFIQHAPDHDPGPGAQDFACGSLTYDGHDGTDFALPSLNAMQAGVAVLAAAPGTVRGLRDGMADIRQGDAGAPTVAGRECGNGVVLSHEDDWETQYCHLKQGSIRVKAGDRVAAGTPLGEIGLSGMTEFPHLHLSLRRNGTEVDPFAPEAQSTCGASQPDLWQPDLALQPGGLITGGFASEVPAYDAVQQGDVARPDATSPGFVFWAYLYGTRAGDRLDLRLTGPDGILAEENVTLERTQAQSFRALGKRLRAARWPSGNYIGEAVLHRGDAVIDRHRAEITLP